MSKRTKANNNKKSSAKPLSAKPAKEKQVFLTDDECSEIWNLLEELPKEAAEDFLSKLEPEMLNQIRTKKNPYKLPVFKGNDNRLLIFTAIPLSETYAKRFAMTSLIGYVFRMLDEYKPTHITLPKEEDPEFQTHFNTFLQKLESERPYKEIDAKLSTLDAYITSLTNLISKAESGDGEGGGVDSTPQYTADGEQTWDSMNRSQLYTLKQQYYKEQYEYRARRTLYNIDVNTREISNLEVKLVGMNHKKVESGKLVDNVTEIIKKFETELVNLEKYYTENPDQEPDDRLTVDKTREESTESSKMRSRKTVRDTIDVYKTNLEKYAAELNKVTSQIDEINSRIEVAKAENTKLKQSLESLKQEYYKLFGNSNGHVVAKRADRSNAPAKAKMQKPKPAKTPHHSVFKHLDYNYDLVDEDYVEARRLTKEKLDIKKTYEEKVEKIQNYISDFLQDHFRYNPDNHVSCSYMPNYDDYTRTPLEVDEHRTIKEQEYSRSLLPPDDTFFKWQRYTDNNYEQLRQATDDIYCEKADLELNIVPMEVVEDADPDVAREKALEFCRKYRNEFEAEVRIAKFRVNSLLGSWQQNRERIDFYNENTEVIKRIIDQHKKDSKMGPKLMKDRVERKRDKNIKVAGENDTAFKEFRKNAPNKLDSIGVKHASEITEKDIPTDKKAANDSELEVGVHVIKPVRQGRRIYGRTKQSHFNIPAEDPNPQDEMKLQTASDRKQDFIDNKVPDQ